MIRVMVVDDSALVRKVLTDMIDRAPNMEVVGTAPDPYAAREKIKKLNPDVLTLDVEMPKMDGIDFLEKIMRLRPMPVVMVSSLTEKGNETTLRALELGAVDFITKPKVEVAEGLQEYTEELHDKIQAAALSKVGRRSRNQAPDKPVVARASQRISSEKLIIVGASTGGTEAIRTLLQGLPPESPAILITQHMPGGFTRSFAERLDGQVALTVQEASDGTRVRPGNVYIAPGGRHMRVIRSGADYQVALNDAPPVNRHRPSVDVLFESAATAVGRNAIGMILTGMGNDGAKGLAAMQAAGARTFAQDEATCVVYGMPREAVALGAADEVLPLARLAAAALGAAEQAGRATRL
ncbi:MAG: chemotaxis response regulator protein-glutamate methylesterase [Marinobacter sp.]|uniref:protein-glutamate methylesterase/protein-glutamine glutaminase n=1 Tax=Marinobacter sp. TaxID=50741 RepID=UPI00299DFF63|nr:chemotaxis response regulator protein-glutamate methylesterase [Marinobacter sp.]MDX1635159.1 chemotaxis response regulator protein-glutamate methylesterase [Marinobacter sp.]